MDLDEAREVIAHAYEYGQGDMSALAEAATVADGEAKRLAAEVERLQRRANAAQARASRHIYRALDAESEAARMRPVVDAALAWATCPDGGPAVACSALYAAAWRAVKAMGYRRLITYTQDSETGASLRGAGWRVVAHRPPRKGWDMPGRPRVDTHPTGVARTLWEAS